MVKPTGWQTFKYDFVDGKYLYNRCHLLGFQLTGENANEKNLITGTRYMNVDGMLPFEDTIANYVKHTGNHVLYRVTPIFDGDNLLANGVLMEAKSVEDNGENVCFNVFCYNVQPNVKIDYSNGNNSENYSEQTPVITTVITTPVTTPFVQATITQAQTPVQNQTTYILNTNTKKFHHPSCSSVGQMNEENKKEHKGTRDEVIAMGYVPCKRCNP